MRGRSVLRRWTGALLAALLPLSTLFAAGSAHAAQVTDVADAAEPDNPIDVNLDARWRYARRGTKITREYTDPVENRRKNVSELLYVRAQNILDTKITVGLFRDLEVRFTLPIVLSDEQTWNWATVEGESVESRSTIANNRHNANGEYLDQGGEQTRPIFHVPWAVYRAGMLDPTLGVSWGILNDHRDRTLDPRVYPSRVRSAALVVGFDWTIPAVEPMDPSRARPAVGSASPPALDPNNPLSVGGGAHRLQWWVAMSKRLGIVEPFLRFHYTLGLAAENAFDNCRAVEKDPDGFVFTREARQICLGNPQETYWVGRTRLDPPHVGGILVGAELVPVENKDGLKLTLGAQLQADYVSRGRGYTDLSDIMGKLTYANQHFVLDGRLTVDLRFNKYVHLVTYVSLGTSTPYELTFESVGRDLFGEEPGDGRPDSKVLLGSEEVNPNHDFRADQEGRRFRAAEVGLFGVSTMLSVNF